MSRPAVQPSRVRIVMLIGTLERGGSEGQLVALATRLDAARYDVRVCCLTASGPLAAPLAAAGIPVDVLGWRGFPAFSGLGALAGLAQFLAIVLRLGRYFRQHGVSIVQGQLFWAYVIGAFAARLARVPVIITCRRSLPMFKSANARHLQLERLANRVTTLVIANAEQVRHATIETEAVPPARVITIHNGVDTSRVRDPRVTSALRETLGIADDALVVLCVANLISYKGHVDLLEAWKVVHEQVPSTCLLLVGEGPERCSLEAAMSGLRSVRLLGSRDDVPELMHAANVGVQASHEEGLPNAVLEAMAAGLAVVATDVGGTSELVVEGVTGRLVRPRDPIGLAAALVALLTDPEGREQMGRAAFERIRDHFSMDVMVRRYASTYDRLLAEATR